MIALMGKVIMSSKIITKVKKFISKSKIFRPIIIISSCMVLLICWFYTIIFNKRILVISSSIGNLGNRLFLFSNFISFAAENNFEVINPTFYEFADYFESTRHHFLCKYPTRRTFIPKNNLVLGSIFLKLIYSASTVVQMMPKNIFFHTVALEKAEERLNLDREDFLKMISGKRVIFFVDGFL